MMIAELLKADGTRTPLSPKNGKEFALDELQAHVGGFIEIIRLRGKKLLVVNENGRLNNLPLNESASLEFLRSFPSVRTYIVGDAVLCDTGMIK